MKVKIEDANMTVHNMQHGHYVLHVFDNLGSWLSKHKIRERVLGQDFEINWYKVWMHGKHCLET